ncbi:MAG: YeeE/YedE thiosulfate transporter family protein [Victivallaceae bacterium]|nr:YeeE/YedE thiosulfate transporter family protein [Victivallaceae bacterium]
MNYLSGKWAFWVVGPLLAAFFTLAFYLFNEAPGLGNSFTVLTEYCKGSVQNQKLNAPPPVNWQFGLLLGTVIGALAGSLISGSFKLRLSEGQDGVFPLKIIKSVLMGLAGGVAIMLGIQLSGDSVMGHTAGAMMMSPGSWIFLTAMYASGMFSAILAERHSGAKKSGE